MINNDNDRTTQPQHTVPVSAEIAQNNITITHSVTQHVARTQKNLLNQMPAEAGRRPTGRGRGGTWYVHTRVVVVVVTHVHTRTHTILFLSQHTHTTHHTLHATCNVCARDRYTIYLC